MKTNITKQKSIKVSEKTWDLMWNFKRTNKIKSMDLLISTVLKIMNKFKPELKEVLK